MSALAGALVLPAVALALGIAPGASAARSQGAGAAATPPGLKVSDAWFGRPEKGPSLGFFTIANAGPQPVLMTGWSSPACKAIEFHEASDIREGPGAPVLTRVTVPPKQTLAFVHGGYHLTCRSPTDAVAVGKRIPVTISFRGGGKLTTPFEVRAVASSPASPNPTRDTDGAKAQ